jgi:ATP-dependent RNA helicase DDX6/DHH1
VPTRELALQVSAEIKLLGKHLGVKCMISTGGTSFKDDVMRLNDTVNVLVGTPGRVLDLLRKKVAHVHKTEMLVLDEADKLLSVDFQEIIERIINFFPNKRQLLLLSATFPTSIKQFKDKYMAEAELVNLMEELTLVGVTQYYVYLEDK